MASMNPGIILGVQQPDFVNTLARSTQAAGMANQNRRQNALEQVYQQYGQGITQGDQNALNALAQYDPQAALGMKQTQQSMQFDQEKMRMLRDKAKLDAQMQAAQLSAAERQQAADNLKAVLSGAATLYQQGDRAGYQAWIQKNGLDPAQYTFDQFPAHLASATGTIEALTEAQEYMQGPEPADEYGRYAAEERAAGREPLSRIEYAQAKKGKGFSVTTKDGTTVTYGGPADSKPNSAANPSSAMSMINTIDGILNDPALEYSTGILSPLQKVPGTPMKRFEGRANQLGGQAFLQAFESLKGGGQITEIEGAKATQAMGRLDTAQSPEDYREALTELRSILAVAAERPQGWVDTQRKINDAQELIPADDIKAMTPDQILQLGPDAVNRIPASELKGLSAEQWDALEALAGQ